MFWSETDQANNQTPAISACVRGWCGGRFALCMHISRRLCAARIRCAKLYCAQVLGNVCVRVVFAGRAAPVRFGFRWRFGVAARRRRESRDADLCARAQPRLRNSCECHIAQARSSALHRNPIKITSTCLRTAQNPVVRVRVRHHKLEHAASAHAVCGCLSIHTTPWFASARLRCAEHFVCKLCAKNGRAQHLWLLSSRRTQKHYARGVCNAI